MASKASNLLGVLYAAESSFGENSSSVTIRLRPTSVDTSGLEFPSQDIGIVRQYPHEGAKNVRMPMGGSFSMDIPLTGLGGTCASSPPASDLVTFLGRIFGVSASFLGTGDTCTGGTAAVPTTTGASGVTAGSIVRVGDKGDGGMDGQWVPVGTHSSNNLTLLLAGPAAPSASDVLYCARGIYESSTSGTFETIASLRFGIRTSQQQYLCHGCYPTSVTWNFPIGGLPSISVTYAVAWWELTNTTFPITTAPDSFTPAPIAAGSMAYAAVGTTTRSTATIREFSFTTELNNQGEMGPNGVDEHQAIVGCNRGPSRNTFSFLVDSEAAGTDTWGDYWDTDENSQVNKQFCFSLSVGDGRSIGWYAPNAKIIGSKPIQIDHEGVNRKRVEFECQTGPTTTSDLTLSPWRMGFA